MRAALDAEILHEETAQRRMGALRDQLHDLLAATQASVADSYLAVCESFGVSMDDINGRSRAGDVSAARHVLCWLLRDQGMSFPDIAAVVGGRDHSTAIHSVRRVDSDKALRHCAGLIRAQMIDARPSTVVPLGMRSAS